MRFCKRHLVIILIQFSVFSFSCNAENSIDIYSKGTQRIPIFMDYSACDDETTCKIGSEIGTIIGNDLNWSGYFDMKHIDPSIGHEKGILMSYSRDHDCNYFISGHVVKGSLGSYIVAFTLWDVFSESHIVQKRYAIARDAIRKVGHMISDEIMFHTTGQKGFFLSKVIYVNERLNKNRRVIAKRIAVMDQDGHNHKILTQNGITINPSFSKANRSIVYTAIYPDQSRIQAINVSNGKISDLGRLHSYLYGKNLLSPQISPDGSTIAFSLLENSNSNIYKYDFITSSLVRMTNVGINVSPSFSPNGKYITFNSDMHGKPNIYIMTSNGLDLRKVTHDAGYYTEPSFSPDGQWIVFTKLRRNVFHIGIIRPDGGDERILSSSYMAESPTWSPSGKEIAFVFKESEGSVNKIKVISIGGRELRVLEASNSGASDPLWIMID